MTELNRRIRTLAPVLNTQSYVHTFAPGLDTMLKNLDGSSYVFAMPKAGAQPGPRTLRLPEAAGLGLQRGGAVREPDPSGEGRWLHRLLRAGEHLPRLQGHAMSAPVEVGLVGAGPWARDFHAPMFAAGPRPGWRVSGAGGPRPRRRWPSASACPPSPPTSGCWSAARPWSSPSRPTSRRSWPSSGGRGRALLLEKPIALTVRDAKALADAVDATGVATQLVLTNRYRPVVREFLEAGPRLPGHRRPRLQLTGEFLDDTFADSPWRSRAGVLYNTGPHGLDLLDAALGRITEIRPAGNQAGFLALTCLHENEVISQLTISGRVPPRRRTRYELYGPEGTLVLDSELLPEDSTETRATLRSEFATAVRTGRSHEIDVHLGPAPATAPGAGRAALRGHRDRRGFAIPQAQRGLFQAAASSARPAAARWRPWPATPARAPGARTGPGPAGRGRPAGRCRTTGRTSRWDGAATPARGRR